MMGKPGVERASGQRAYRKNMESLMLPVARMVFFRSQQVHLCCHAIYVDQLKITKKQTKNQAKLFNSNLLS